MVGIGGLEQVLHCVAVYNMGMMAAAPDLLGRWHRKPLEFYSPTIRQGPRT